MLRRWAARVAGRRAATRPPPRRKSVRRGNRSPLLGGAGSHVVREEMRDPAHEADPRPKGAEPRHWGDAEGGAEHQERVAEAHAHERAEPQPEIRSPPRHGGREEPSDDDQQVSQPAGHLRALPAHAFRATAATASTVSVSANPAPAVTGNMTGEPAMRAITAMS